MLALPWNILPRTHVYTGTCIQKLPGHEATIFYSLAMKGFLSYVFKRNTIASLPPSSLTQLPSHLWYTFHGIHHRALVKGLGTSRRKRQKGCKSQNTRKSAGKIFPRNGFTKKTGTKAMSAGILARKEGHFVESHPYTKNASPQLTAGRREICLVPGLRPLLVVQRRKGISSSC